MSPSLPLHGGDLWLAEKRWGRPRQGWLDLSTGINPWPYPIPAIAQEVWARLPDRALDAATRQAASTHYSAPSPDHILAAPGSSALIQAVPRLFPPADVAVVGPTYGEHAPAWEAAGHKVAVVPSLAGIGDARHVVLVNPNNPDGRLVPPAQVLACSAELRRRGGMMVVDEAFADCLTEASILPGGAENAIVLRSFGKFFGLAGIRLGFAVAPPATLAELAALLGPWPVAGPALEIGRMALADRTWTQEAQRRLVEAAAGLERVLDSNGFGIVGGTPLFRLARHDRAQHLWHKLGQAGILVRAFAQSPHQLRFGLPAEPDGLARLEQALRD